MDFERYSEEPSQRSTFTIESITCKGLGCKGKGDETLNDIVSSKHACVYQDVFEYNVIHIHA